MLATEASLHEAQQTIAELKGEIAARDKALLHSKLSLRGVTDQLERTRQRAAEYGLQLVEAAAQLESAHVVARTVSKKCFETQLVNQALSRQLAYVMTLRMRS